MVGEKRPCWTTEDLSPDFVNDSTLFLLGKFKSSTIPSNVESHVLTRTSMIFKDITALDSPQLNYVLNQLSMKQKLETFGDLQLALLSSDFILEELAYLANIIQYLVSISSHSNCHRIKCIEILTKIFQTDGIFEFLSSGMNFDKLLGIDQMYLQLASNQMMAIQIIKMKILCSLSFIDIINIEEKLILFTKLFNENMTFVPKPKYEKTLNQHLLLMKSDLENWISLLFMSILEYNFADKPQCNYVAIHNHLLAFRDNDHLNAKFIWYSYLSILSSNDINIPKEVDTDYFDLFQSMLHEGAIHRLLQSVKNLMISENKDNIQSIFYSVLISFVLSFDFSEFKDLAIIVDCFVLCLEDNINLCSIFWNRDWPKPEVINLVNLISSRFPSELDLLLRFLTPMISLDSSRQIFDLMENLTTLSTENPDLKFVEMESNAGVNLYRAIKPFQISVNNVAILMDENSIGEDYDVLKTVWDVEYSGWRYLSRLLQSDLKTLPREMLFAVLLFMEKMIITSSEVAAFIENSVATIDPCFFDANCQSLCKICYCIAVGHSCSEVKLHGFRSLNGLLASGMVQDFIESGIYQIEVLNQANHLLNQFNCLDCEALLACEMIKFASLLYQMVIFEASHSNIIVSILNSVSRLYKLTAQTKILLLTNFCKLISVVLPRMNLGTEEANMLQNTLDAEIVQVIKSFSSGIWEPFLELLSVILSPSFGCILPLTNVTLFETELVNLIKLSSNSSSHFYALMKLITADLLPKHSVINVDENVLQLLHSAFTYHMNIASLSNFLSAFYSTDFKIFQKLIDLKESSLIKQLCVQIQNSSDFLEIDEFLQLIVRLLTNPAQFVTIHKTFRFHDKTFLDSLFNNLISKISEGHSNIAESFLSVLSGIFSITTLSSVVCSSLLNSLTEEVLFSLLQVSFTGDLSDILSLQCCKFVEVVGTSSKQDLQIKILEALDKLISKVEFEKVTLIVNSLAPYLTCKKQLKPLIKDLLDRFECWTSITTTSLDEESCEIWANFIPIVMNAFDHNIKELSKTHLLSLMNAICQQLSIRPEMLSEQILLAISLFILDPSLQVDTVKLLKHDFLSRPICKELVSLSEKNSFDLFPIFLSSKEFALELVELGFLENLGLVYAKTPNEEKMWKVWILLSCHIDRSAQLRLLFYFGNFFKLVEKMNNKSHVYFLELLAIASELMIKDSSSFELDLLATCRFCLSLLCKHNAQTSASALQILTCAVLGTLENRRASQIILSAFTECCPSCSKRFGSHLESLPQGLISEKDLEMVIELRKFTSQFSQHLTDECLNFNSLSIR